MSKEGEEYNNPSARGKSAHRAQITGSETESPLHSRATANSSGSSLSYSCMMNVYADVFFSTTDAISKCHILSE